MIITHATDPHGNRRVYLGVKSSFECWIAPGEDGRSWSFQCAPSLCSLPLPEADQRACAAAALLGLADELNVAPPELKFVPFETIAALHTGGSSEGRRVAVPRSRATAYGFMSTAPGITRPRADFNSGEHQQMPDRA
ncbi:MAG: hypothetical protein JSR99_18950 [Proteobacteria bacterium]|nr:hypothetical protein [Pseudomonadota bacterium]